MDILSVIDAAGKWFNSLPDGVKQTLTAMAGEIGAAAAQGVFASARQRLRSLFQRGLPEDAVANAIASALQSALLQTLVPLTHTQAEFEHYLRTLLGPWLQRPVVQAEFAKLVAPAPDLEPDRDVLRAEFSTVDDHDPDSLNAPFATIVAMLIDQFQIAAAWQGELQSVVALRSERTIQAQIQKLIPLDLDALIRTNYLAGVLDDAETVLLVRGKKDDPTDQLPAPSLQRVFVDLRVDQEPTFDQFTARLGIDAWRRPFVEESIRTVCTANASRPSVSVQDDTSWDDTRWLDSVRGLDAERLADLAKRLHVDDADLKPATAELTPLELLATLKHPQVVLLGKPGGGKSTLTRRVAGVLAKLGQPAPEPLLDDFERVWIDQLGAAFGRWLLPVRVVMSRWAQRAPTAPGSADDLIAECVRLVQQTCSAAADRLPQTVAGRFVGDQPTVCVLLDGLDEVTDPAQRATLIGAVNDFCTKYGQVPLIVTCRSRPYAALSAEAKRKHRPWLQLPTATLQPLTLEAQELFVARWHDEMEAIRRYEPAKATLARANMRHALTHPSRQELQEMAGTPLLLTMMVIGNYKHGLPDSRARLYEQLVQQLLFEWEHIRLDADGQKSGIEQILETGKIRKRDLESRLNELAFAVHDPTQSRDTVDIPKHRLLAALKRAYASDLEDFDTDLKATTWGMQVLHLVASRSGLINEVNIVPAAEDEAPRPQESTYQFVHRTFQEYLAARWLATAVDDSSGEEISYRLIEARIDQPEWREAILLAIGCCQVEGLNVPYYRIANILHGLWPEPAQQPALWPRTLLLGEAYVHLFGEDRLRQAGNRKVAQDLQQWVRQDLRRIRQDRERSAQERLQAGLLLDDLGVAPSGLDEFIAVPNTTLHVGKYPVTNGQFKRFVAAGGYGEAKGQRPSWWSEQGWKYRCEEDWTAPRYLDDRRLNRTTQPVVGVSWYEADAYCNWLNAQASVAQLPDGSGYLPVGTRAKLPTQDEWMLAARNGQAAPAKDEHDYPWSGPFDKALANTEESNLDQTTPVDMYTGGATPAGVYDMAGNVFEWTLDHDKDDWYYVKGGCFYLNAARARASAAGVRYYRNFRAGGGFRVVCVPIISHGQF